MFTLEQLKTAHAQVTSGADFPRYIQAIKTLGVVSYETFVADGHTDYAGKDHYTIASPARYAPLVIATTPDAETFTQELKAHQQGKTDYPTFCGVCASTGVNKWVVRLEAMTCTYYDVAGREVLVEKIPGD
jgi:uncharacterized protein YbcV (DUF1398 family)